MDIIEKIRNMVLRFLRIDHLSEDPTDDRLTFINNPKDVIKQDISEARVWFVGDSNELLNYYTQKQAVGNYNEPIYNRNRVNYFWGLSSQEANIKRVHSGLATAIVDTLVNITDFPQITAMANGKELDLERIFKETQFKSVIMQSQMPWMLAEGYGALKFDIDRSVSKMPIVEYYEGKDVEFISKRGRVIGVIFKDYYKYKGNDYVLLDTRRLDETCSSCVEYELFKLSPNGDVDQCELDEVPELGKLKDLKIPGYGKLLAVPCKFLSHPNDKSYGKPLLYGRYDLLDDLDQSLSQRSVTSRESTPVEYIPSDLLERNKEGQPILPKRYNRTYVAKDGIPNGDGAMDGQIQTTQPNLNFDQYTQEQKAIVDQILIGILSPASMGIDIAKKDNGEAQREKEKATLMTRNNIINCETQILTQAVNIILALTAYMESGNLPLADFDVSVKYGEFANPSFENVSKTLLPLWQAGAISDEMYIDKLYGDSLSQAEKQKELEALKAKRSEDTLKMGDFDESGMGSDLAQQANLVGQGKASQ